MRKCQWKMTAIAFQPQALYQDETWYLCFGGKCLLEDIMKVSEKVSGTAESGSVSSIMNKNFTEAFEYQTNPSKRSTGHRALSSR